MKHLITPTEEVAGHELPIPERDFALARRLLVIALVLSVAIPLLFITGYGYFEYRRQFSDAEDMIDRLSRVAEEQAVKVLDLNRELSSRIVETVGLNSDSQIIAREAEIHQKLHEMTQQLPQIASISVFGSDGKLLVNSKYYPVPEVSIAEREDFRSARDVGPRSHVSLPVRSKIGGTDIFNTTTPRLTGDGRFLGVISIALKREYFVSFYHELASQDSALTLGLYRQDGGILVRYPEPKVHPPPILNIPLASAIRENLTRGHLTFMSTVDGANKALAYRRAGEYPLYVSAGYPVSAIYRRWLDRDLIVALVTLVPCFGVWLLVGFSLKRLKSERNAWESWRAEVARRTFAETKSRQLQRMGSLGNLVANVAHDFNNLLMVVTANMELARRKNFTGVANEVIAVERASVTANVLARRLLSVARKQPLRQESVRLQQWMTEALALIQASLGDETTVTCLVDSDTWPVCVDSTELEAAIINIAVNAKEAMSDVKGFRIYCENVQLADDRTGESLVGDYVLISCTDIGRGMDIAVCLRAFEPLFTTKGSGNGTGLGLAQVLAMCEQVGGTARITSKLGEGTTVRLYLPRCDVAPKSMVKPEPLAIETNEPGSILLVEDNEEVAAGLAAVLETFGWQSRHELTGDAALRVLESGARFDLVLSDIQMPGKASGVDVAERVRCEWPNQAIALMTGYAEELEQAKHLGVTVLSKPFNIDDLQALLQRFRRPDYRPPA